MLLGRSLSVSACSVTWHASVLSRTLERRPKIELNIQSIPDQLTYVIGE
jgi:hypothetical protein